MPSLLTIASKAGEDKSEPTTTYLSKEAVQAQGEVQYTEYTQSYLNNPSHDDASFKHTLISFLNTILTSGVYLSLFTALVFSFETLLIRCLSIHMNATFEFIAILSFLKLSIIISFSKINKIPCFINKDKDISYISLFMTSAFLVIFQICMYVSITLIPLVDVMSFYYLVPVILTLFLSLKSALFKVPTVIGALLAMSGAILITRPSFISSSVVWDFDRCLGIFLAVMSMISVIIALLLSQQLKKQSSLVVMTYMYLMEMVLSLVIMIMGWPGGMEIEKEIVFYFYLMLIVVIGVTGHGLVKMMGKIGDFSWQRMMAVESSQLVWLAVWGTVLVPDELSWLTGIGIMAIIIGLNLISTDKKQISQNNCIVMCTEAVILRKDESMLEPEERNNKISLSSIDLSSKRILGKGKLILNKIKEIRGNLKKNIDAENEQNNIGVNRNENMFISNPTWNMVETGDLTYSQTTTMSSFQCDVQNLK